MNIVDTEYYRFLAHQCHVDEVNIDWLRPMCGLHHMVFPFIGENETTHVVKFPRKITSHVGVVHHVEQERENISTVQEYFGPYYPGCEIYCAENDSTYCMKMPFIHGKFLDESSKYNPNLQNLLAAHQKLEQERGLHLDLLGMPGVKNYALGRSVVMANVLTTDQDTIHIVDHDLFNIREPYAFLLSTALRLITKQRFYPKQHAEHAA